MKIITNSPGIAIGPVVHAFDPPQKKACFCVILPIGLVPNAAAKPLEDKVLPGGDRHVDDDLAKALLQPSDLVPFKPRADVILVAKAHSPGGQPVKQLDAGFRVGGLSKTVRVFGKRKWKVGLLGSSAATEIEPFQNLPLVYEFANGGAKSKLNPLGSGLDGEDMPRIEDPKQPLAKPRSDAPPAGFMPIPASWQQRASLIGTYGKKWLKERWPWFPEDFDYGYFNAAPRDQQIEGYLKGNEELQFDNLHAEHSVYKSRLPGLRMRLFVTVRTLGGSEFREVPVKLDTLWIDMDQEKGILAWRGAIEVKTPKMREIVSLLACTEPLAEPAKSLAHYEQFFAEQVRLETADLAPVMAFDEAAFAATFALMDKEFAETEKAMAAAEAELNKLLDDEQNQPIAEGEAVDAALFAGAPESSGLDELRASLADDEDLSPAQRADIESQIAETAGLEKEIADMDASFAKDFPPPPTRDDVLAAAKTGGSLEGLRLRGMDLAGISLVGVALQGVDLKTANLAGAKLAGVNLVEANLTEANLSGADLTSAKLDQADFTGSVVAGAKFQGASLESATLAGLDFSGAEFSQCRAEGADFTGANLAGANFSGARLARADFTECNLEGADLRNADLTRACFSKAQAKGVLLEGADLSHAVLDQGADFTGANFKKATAPKAVFEAAILDGADFTRASLPGAQFGEASLKETVFDRAILSGSSFDDSLLQKTALTRANLLRCTFDRADLTEANLESANAYEAGFWEAIVKDAKLKNANLRSTLLG